MYHYNDYGIAYIPYYAIIFTIVIFENIYKSTLKHRKLFTYTIVNI